MNDVVQIANAVQIVEVHPHLAVAVAASVPAALAGGMTGMNAGGVADLHPREVRVGGVSLQWTTGRGTTLGTGLEHLPWMTVP